MNKNSTIRTILALFAIIVFAYSITPKIVLHNLVANHVDNKKVFSSNGTEVSFAGVHCKCDNLVAESPFVPGEQFIPGIESLHSLQFTETSITCVSFAQLFAELRGPPFS